MSAATVVRVGLGLSHAWPDLRKYPPVCMLADLWTYPCTDRRSLSSSGSHFSWRRRGARRWLRNSDVQLDRPIQSREFDPSIEFEAPLLAKEETIHPCPASLQNQRNRNATSSQQMLRRRMSRSLLLSFATRWKQHWHHPSAVAEVSHEQVSVQAAGA